MKIVKSFHSLLYSPVARIFLSVIHRCVCMCTDMCEDIEDNTKQIQFPLLHTLPDITGDTIIPRPRWSLKAAVLWDPPCVPTFGCNWSLTFRQQVGTNSRFCGLLTGKMDEKPTLICRCELTDHLLHDNRCMAGLQASRSPPRPARHHLHISLVRATAHLLFSSSRATV